MRAPVVRLPWSIDQVEAELARRRAVQEQARRAADGPIVKTAASIRSDTELLAYVERTFGVRIPTTRVCEHHCAPATAFCDAYFGRHPVMIWKGSRGFAGKSFTLATLGVVMAATLKADVTVLGGSGQQSARVLEAMDKLWAAPEAPRELLDGEPGQYVTRFKDGQKIVALTASQASVRGPHPQALLMDEIDEMSPKILEAAQGQPMDKGDVLGRTVLSSTHQYQNGTMTAMLARAADKGYPVYEWCWRETVEPHGWLTQAQVVRKRHEITEAMWNTEYDLQAPSEEGLAINRERVEAIFRRELGTVPGAENECYLFEAPIPAARYVHSADWARKQDHTVILTWRVDVVPYRIVAFERMQKRPWPYMVGRLDARMDAYPGPCLHDATGIGDVVQGYVKHQIEPFLMLGRARHDVLTEYIAAVERGDVESPYIESMAGEHRYATTDDVFGAGHLPDTISAGALGYRAAKSLPQTPDGVLDIGAEESTELGSATVL